MALARGAQRRVAACEPNPLLAETYLPGNLALNGCREQVEICDKAIGWRDQECRGFVLHQGAYATSSAELAPSRIVWQGWILHHGDYATSFTKLAPNRVLRQDSVLHRGHCPTLWANSSSNRVVRQDVILRYDNYATATLERCAYPHGAEAMQVPMATLDRRPKTNYSPRCGKPGDPGARGHARPALRRLAAPRPGEDRRRPSRGPGLRRLPANRLAVPACRRARRATASARPAADHELPGSTRAERLQPSLGELRQGRAADRLGRHRRQSAGRLDSMAAKVISSGPDVWCSRVCPRRPASCEHCQAGQTFLDLNRLCSCFIGFRGCVADGRRAVGER